MTAGKKNLLGIKIDATDYEGAVHQIMAAAQARQPFAVSALAVHGVMTGVLDAAQRQRLNGLDLIVPDGQPVRWALNLLHRAQLRDRVYGPTLTLKVCERAAQEGLPIYLYGSKSEVLGQLAANLRAKFPGLKIAGMQASRFRQVSRAEQEQIAAQIRASGAALTLVGLGCPRQEVWAYENRELLSMPLLAVGAAFDFHAGTLSQAPALMQQYGLEWFYRMMCEPRRLWRRYVFLNPAYLALVLMQMTGIKKYAPTSQETPVPALRYG